MMIMEEVTLTFKHARNKLFRGLLILYCILISLAAEGFAHDRKAPAPIGKKSAAILTGMAVHQPLGIANITITSSMGGFEAAAGEEHIQDYFVSGTGFGSGETVTVVISGSGFFTIASESTSGTYVTSIEITTDPFGEFEERISVKYAPTEEGPHTATIDHSGPNADTQSLTVEGNATALPVEWLSFKARAVKGAIVLEWVTASEKNNSHFEVELSKNPLVGFEKIGRVESKGGNSQSAIHYSFAYYLEAAMGTYYFRLKQVDTDQAFEYSKVVAIEMVGASGADVKVAPNPVTPASQLSIAVAEAGELRVLVLAMNGTTVYSKNFALEAGANKIQLGLTDGIGHGVYMLSTEFKGRFSRLKLIKE
jgi:hypothetical protein